jgi:hypothetical protein
VIWKIAIYKLSIGSRSAKYLVVSRIKRKR